ncbi:ABC transporter ATP-binding protein [Nocardia sp. NPDC088792]|uniref:ABC transporter ATP-binding protein n=1 Tax=Nocardia sp. NPDC088792 TaxID=3364332 RepID=UPI00381765B0
MDTKNDPPLDGIAVRGRGLTKCFSDLTAVDAVDIDVYSGEFFGLLGPNGAGKSSTMRMLSCISRPTAGDLRVLGRDPRRDAARIRRNLGIVHQENNLDIDLTALENLTTYARYFGYPRPEARRRGKEMLHFAQLDEKADTRADDLSGGMQRRLAIARGLVNSPELVFLDEPTTGLDPQMRHIVWQRLLELKQQRTTLVLTTHYMDEAEQLCDRIVIIDRGHIVAEGTPQVLIKEHAGQEVVELWFPDSPTEETTLLLGGIAEQFDILPDRVILYVPHGDSAVSEVHRRGLSPTRVTVRRSTLEDVFLRLTGRTLAE